jgi:hypothetical protein
MPPRRPEREKTFPLRKTCLAEKSFSQKDDSVVKQRYQENTDYTYLPPRGFETDSLVTDSKL